MEDHLNPSQPHTLVAILKACAKQKDLQRGSKIHADIIRTGLLEKYAYLGSTLISMYFKCGSPEKAEEVFDQMHVQTVVSWNALMSGYAKHGCVAQALKCYERMRLEGLAPDSVTYICILRACGNLGVPEKGREIHADIVRDGLLEKDDVVGGALIDMYTKCGLLVKAQEVFSELPVRDLVAWSALMAGYAEHGHGGQILKCFEQMQLEGISLDAVTYIGVLKACGSIKNAENGAKIHVEILEDGLVNKDIIVGTALVDMYAKCGLVAQAQKVFNKLPAWDVVSFNALIAGYAQHGHGQQAIDCYERMQLQGLCPNAATFICVLKACGSIGAADKGKVIHGLIVGEGLLQRDIVVGSAVVDMYAKCGLLARAQEVLHELPVRNVVSWSSLMGGYVQHGCSEKALKCFEHMRFEGLSPDAVTFACILKACSSIGAVDKGEELHDEIIRERLLEKDITVGNALIDMYAKCGLITKAQEVFEGLPFRDVVSWNVLIAGYAQHGLGMEAMKCFDQMQLQGLSPNAATFVCILKACGSTGNAERGEEIHADIEREGLLKKNIVVGTALVDMYAKCGLLEKAQEVFNELPVRNIVSWNALMAGYAQHDLGEQVLECFERLQLKGLSPNTITCIYILKACGSTGAADKGNEIHAEIVREGLLGKDIAVGTALIDMYIKCGLLSKAQEVFDMLPNRDVVSWGALMAGYALLGRPEYTFYLFEKMIGEGIKPNSTSFIIVLNACSHTGLLEKGQMYFGIMNEGYGIVPTSEHYTCMVDLFARAGHLHMAVAMIEKMPFSADLTVWLLVLGACKKWGNLKLGRLAFESALQLDEKVAAPYVCMSNIYVAAGRQEDADKVEAMRIKNHAQDKRVTDASWLLESYFIGDIRHLQIKNVNEELALACQRRIMEEI